MLWQVLIVDAGAFKISNEDLIITIRLATELIIEAQNELSGCERRTTLIQMNQLVSG